MEPTEVFDMATVTVKNIPDDLYARLKSVAVMNRRSVNSEIVMCIDRAVVSRPIDPAKLLEEARQLRKLSSDHPIADEEFNQAKARGRP
jgi:plasmid stability protein